MEIEVSAVVLAALERLVASVLMKLALGLRETSLVPVFFGAQVSRPQQ